MTDLPTRIEAASAEDVRALIERLRSLLAKATPGPWREREGHYRCIEGSPRDGETYGDSVTTFTGTIASQQGYGRDNSTLIVEAVNALPTLLDTLSDLLERIAELEGLAQRDDAAGPWRPIETAPRDGSFVDLWITNSALIDGGRRVTDVCWLDGAWREYAEWDGDSFVDEDDYGDVRRWFASVGQTLPAETSICKATHWMAPPAPPALRDSPVVFAGSLGPDIREGRARRPLSSATSIPPKTEADSLRQNVE